MRVLVLALYGAACGRIDFAPIGDDARGGDGAPSDGHAPDVAFGDCWPAWHAGTVVLRAPQPLAQLNTMRAGDPWLSPDALSLYFSRGSPGDFFVATRANRHVPFEAAVPVTELNSPDDETKLSMTADGLIVLWSSNRQTSQGYDIWEATRLSTAQPFGTPSKSTLGQVNDNLQQFDPHISGDGLRLYLAAQSGPNQWVTLATRTTSSGNFLFPVDVDDLGTIRNADPALSPDERVIVYAGRQAAGDEMTLWYATRASVSDPFAGARTVPGINDGTLHDQDPAVSYDGCEVYFMSQRSGMSALYVAVVD